MSVREPSRAAAAPSRQGSRGGVRALALLMTVAALGGCEQGPLLPALTRETSGKPAASQRAPAPAPAHLEKAAPSPLAAIPAGRYRPFYKGTTQGESIAVGPFLLERTPVSRAQFLTFVAASPKFRKGSIQPLFAEPSYLSDWRSEFDPGAGASSQPVTFVSWFAARAYCESHGRRLPTMIEWEHAATVEGEDAAAPKVEPTADGVPGSVASEAAFRFAMGRSRAQTKDAQAPVFGEVWEWTSDFNSIFVPKGSVNAKSGDSSLFCGDGMRAVDATDYGGFLRHSFRNSLKANYTLKNLGFRCAKDAS